MVPSEFWNCTYKEVYIYVKSNSLQREQDYKSQIILFDALGEKILDAIARKRPKSTSLIRDKFRDLFKNELEPSNHQQTPEEQIKILRSMK